MFIKISLALGLSIPGAVANSQVNYGEALQKSIYFYEAQQAGVLPEWNRVPWRGDSTLNDGVDVGADLSGGWFDAGDHVKFGFPMASSATLLAWGALAYPEAFEKTSQMKHLKNNLRFVADYFINAHPKPNLLHGQVGTGRDDHVWWGPAEVLESVTRAAGVRPTYSISPECPGSDLAGETAAAMAAMAMVFDDDKEYSTKLIRHARQLLDFAHKYRGNYSDCIKDVKDFYNSWSGHIDELVWGSIWLYKATGEQDYLELAEELYDDLNKEQQSNYRSYKWTHAWDDKSYGSYVLLAQLTNKTKYTQDAERWLDYWSVGFGKERVPYTAGGLAFLDPWGPNRYAANTSFLALIYSDYLKTQDRGALSSRYYQFALSQMEYIMGKNPKGIPYQIGIDSNGPKNPHHRTAHGSWADTSNTPKNNRHLLVGALVGGPRSDDSYDDDRNDYVSNEVTTDYNAGFTGALARLYLDFGGKELPESEFPAPMKKGLEYFTETKVNSSGGNYIEFSTKIFNQSAWPAKVNKNLRFRYWFDLSKELSSGYGIDDFEISMAYSQASSISPLRSWSTKGIYYIELSFENVEIFPGGQSEHQKEAQFRLALKDHAALMDVENDPSWDPAYDDGYVRSEKVSVYEGDKLIWGQEP